MRVGSFRSVWMYSYRAWVILGLISMRKRARLWRDWGGNVEIKCPQPGALTSGVGCPPLSALTTGTVMWKSSVWGLFQLLMSVLSEPRVFELHWSPFGSGTRRHTKAASAHRCRGAACLFSLGWLIRDIHSSFALSCLLTWAHCSHECVCVCLFMCVNVWCVCWLQSVCVEIWLVWRSRFVGVYLPKPRIVLVTLFNDPDDTLDNTFIGDHY